MTTLSGGDSASHVPFLINIARSQNLYLDFSVGFAFFSVVDMIVFEEQSGTVRIIHNICGYPALCLFFIPLILHFPAFSARVVQLIDK